MPQSIPSIYQSADRRDAELFLAYAKAKLTRRGWLMLLSGLAGFQRNREYVLGESQVHAPKC